MNSGWIQLLIYVGLLVAITKPMGLYLVRVLDPEVAGGGTFLDPILGPVERLIYKLMRTDPKREHTWKQYLVAMLIFSAVSAIATYVILRVQSHLPWDYVETLSNKTAMTPDLAFNTAASFTTNTNWQSYGGENTMSYFSQMVGLASHNFLFRGGWHRARGGAGSRDCPRSQPAPSAISGRDLVRIASLSADCRSAWSMRCFWSARE